MTHDELVRKWAERIELYDGRAEGYGDFAELIVRALEMQRERAQDLVGFPLGTPYVRFECPLITPEDLA